MNCKSKPYTVWIEAGSGWFKPSCPERTIYADNADQAAQRWAEEYYGARADAVTIMIESNTTGTIKPFTIKPCARFEVLPGFPCC